MHPAPRSIRLVALVSLAASPIAAQGFGSSATVFGERVLIGEPSSERLPGQVYVYAPEGSGWTLSSTLTAETRRTAFGAALAASDRYVFVGEPRAAGGGRVHVLALRKGDAWEEVATLSAAGVNEFGRGLIPAGDRLLVRAVDASSESDVVLVFAREEDGYEIEGRLAPGRAADGDFVAISTAAYPNVGYAHQGWLSEDQRYFYSNDELDEVGGLVDATRTLIWDVRDLEDPTLVTEYYSPTNVTDHNMYVRGDRLYMSNNRSGLRVVDISDPENPVEIGFFDTTPWSEDEPGFDGTWSVYPYFDSGVVLLSSRREGLFLVKPRERRLIP